MGWPELYDVGRARGGYTLRSDAPGCGISMAEYDRLVSEHRWHRPFLGVRLLPGTALTPLVRHRAAAASVKGAVAADRWSAAWLLGGRRTPPSRPMLVVPSNRRPERQDELIIRRTGVWNPDEVVEINGVPCLIPGRIVVDLAHLGADRDPLRGLGLALRRTTGLNGAQVLAALDGYARHRQRELVLELAELLDTVGSESGLEELARDLLVRAGFDPDRLQVTVDTANGRRRLDIVFRRARVGIEVQSKEYHGDLDAMTRDARKLNALADTDEWLVLVLTPPMLAGEAWVEFVHILRRAIARRS